MWTAICYFNPQGKGLKIPTGKGILETLQNLGKVTPLTGHEDPDGE